MQRLLCAIVVLSACAAPAAWAAAPAWTPAPTLVETMDAAKPRPLLILGPADEVTASAHLVYRADAKAPAIEGQLDVVEHGVLVADPACRTAPQDGSAAKAPAPSDPRPQDPRVSCS
ncbi:hypothetical protein [Phenylobacterium sp.]|uniref:hypothetical protein n=1 Tax=Phenylobacterium sp. TaxID=1871053 RepID=UPI001221AC10|nr:hypothetical protein [Phenylobacterium sp.]THD57788.1 MAG: hypothetical protein E8A49_21535 [Phenylobacterium sp.]